MQIRNPIGTELHLVSFEDSIGPNTVSLILGKIDYTLIFYNGNAKKDTLVVSTSYQSSRLLDTRR